MSSTTPDSRYDFDDYPTPRWCVARLMETPRLAGVRAVWEPFAGQGLLLDELLRWLPEIEAVYATEIQTEHVAAGRGAVPRAEWTHADALSCAVPSVTHVITNPPFKHAQAAVERFLGAGVPSVTFLLRLNFLGGADRTAWLRTCMPRYVDVLPNRPAFRRSKKTGKWGTDSIEYAWMTWEPGGFGDRSELTILSDTPKEVRTADRQELDQLIGHD